MNGAGKTPDTARFSGTEISIASLTRWKRAKIAGHSFWSWNDVRQYARRIDWPTHEGILFSGVVTESREPYPELYMRLSRLFSRTVGVSRELQAGSRFTGSGRPACDSAPFANCGAGRPYPDHRFAASDRFRIGRRIVAVARERPWRRFWPKTHIGPVSSGSEPGNGSAFWRTSIGRDRRRVIRIRAPGRIRSPGCSDCGNSGNSHSDFARLRSDPTFSAMLPFHPVTPWKESLARRAGDFEIRYGRRPQRKHSSAEWLRKSLAPA